MIRRKLDTSMRIAPIVFLGWGLVAIGLLLIHIQAINYSERVLRVVEGSLQEGVGLFGCRKVLEPVSEPTGYGEEVTATHLLQSTWNGSSSRRIACSLSREP